MPTYFPYRGRLYRFRRNGNGNDRRGFKTAAYRYRFKRFTPVAPYGYRGLWGPNKRYAQEEKVIDTALSLKFAINPIEGGPSLKLINGVAVGAQYTARVGNKIQMKSFYIRGTIFNGEADPISQICRILVVYDQQGNGSTISGTDVVRFAATANADLNSMMYMDRRDRFRVIWDKCYSLRQYGATTTEGERLYVKKYKKLNHQVYFGGTDITAGSVNTGGLWIICLGENAVASTNEATLVAQTRIRFTDC